MDVEQRLKIATMAHSARSDLSSVDATFRASPSIKSWLAAFRVFTNWTGEPTKSLYYDLLVTLLTDAGLLTSSSGKRRSIYCFRHNYATFRLTEGVDVYFLAKQMGTSVQMIEQHYGHVNRSSTRNGS